MKTILGVVLLCGLGSFACSTPINMNKHVDRMLPYYNNELRKIGYTTYPLPEISVANVTYSNGFMLGLDSLVRTGNCFFNDKVSHHLAQVDLHLGLNLLTVFLPQLNVDGHQMSAYFRLRGNSAHAVYSLEVTKDKCTASLQELSIDTLGAIEFSSSLPEYDGADLSEFFKSEIAPSVASYIESKKADIVVVLQKAMCRN